MNFWAIFWRVVKCYEFWENFLDLAFLIFGDFQESTRMDGGVIFSFSFWFLRDESEHQEFVDGDVGGRAFHGCFLCNF